MNVKKSILICLANNNMSRQELADELGITKQGLSLIITKNRCSTPMLEDLAAAFKLKVHSFIRLGGR